MILVLAGTRDGREIATEISLQGYSVLVSVVSEYGRDLAAKSELKVNASPLDAHGMAKLIRQEGIKAVIDASHPYAAAISNNALVACRECGVKYLRYERPAVLLPDYDHLHVVPNAGAAAKLAATLGKVIFLTTGSRTLKIFKTEPLLAGHRIIARVLPDSAVLAECMTLGFTPHDIVALQGPFSHELNFALFKEYAAEVVVTKNSGEIGGSDSKITAAIALGLQLVVIDRPTVKYPHKVHSSSEVIEYVREVLS